MLNVQCTTTNFNQFINKLDNLKNGGLVEGGFRKFVEHTRQVAIDGTPIGDDRDEHRGLMKKSWQQPQYSINSRNMTATVTNSVNYGVAENYGHYQTPGVYVPAIDAQLVHRYVPGTYALETSMAKAEMDFTSIIKPEILAVWNDYHISQDYRGETYFTTRQSYYDRPGEERINQ